MKAAKNSTDVVMDKDDYVKEGRRQLSGNHYKEAINKPNPTHLAQCIMKILDKIALTCFHIISGTAPPYLSELLRLYSPSRSQRSASDTRIFRVPRVCRRTLGERSFQYIGPVIWNSLSFSVRHATTLLFQVKTENPPLLFCLPDF